MGVRDLGRYPEFLCGCKRPGETSQNFCEGVRDPWSYPKFLCGCKRPVELSEIDVYGPMSVHARGGFVYFITFIDDHSRYGPLYLMTYKSETFERFKKFRNEVEKQLGRSIKSLRSD